MKINKIIEEVMVETGFGKAQLGRAVGIEDKKRPSDVISKRLGQENISVNIAKEMLDAMGYTMVIVPKGSKIGENEYEVTTK